MVYACSEVGYMAKPAPLWPLRELPHCRCRCQLQHETPVGRLEPRHAKHRLCHRLLCRSIQPGIRSGCLLCATDFTQEPPHNVFSTLLTSDRASRVLSSERPLEAVTFLSLKDFVHKTRRTLKTALINRTNLGKTTLNCGVENNYMMLDHSSGLSAAMCRKYP